jgi:hypothetical protein
VALINQLTTLENWKYATDIDFKLSSLACAIAFWNEPESLESENRPFAARDL